MIHSEVGLARRCARIGVLTGALVTMGCTSDPTGPAGPKTPWALAWADKPSEVGEYEVAPYFSFSTGGKIRSLRTGPGTYTVRFPGLGSGGKKSVHVTAYDFMDQLRRCRVVASSVNARDLLAEVKCHDKDGNLVDSRFTTLVVSEGATQGRNAFVLSPVSGSGPADAATSYNSAQQGIEFIRNSEGNYTVILEGLAPPDASANWKEIIHITSYGDGENWCKVRLWETVFEEGVPTDDLAVNVLCFTPNGTQADARFSLLMLEGGRLGRRLGYVWAHAESAAGEYTPIPKFNFNSSGTPNTVNHYGDGKYSVYWPGLERAATSTAETILVTAYGRNSDYCLISNWLSTGYTNFRCYSPSGAFVNSQFTAIWIE
jgi:hypothetical protein